MRYPNFLKSGQTVGICPLSAGCGHKLSDLIESIEVLKNEGYRIRETESVRVDALAAAKPEKRADELHELLKDDEISFIMLAAGGDLQIETLPYIDFDCVDKHPKWIMGMSDPTNLLYPMTCKLDIASIYGFNGSSYELKDEKDQKDNLNIIKGNPIEQESYDYYYDFLESKKGIINPISNIWKGSSENLEIRGRCIGGCIDSIAKLIGTKYDYTLDFVERYKDEGIVWYFDNYALTAYNIYLTLLQMKYAGYFENCRGVLLGRPAFPSFMDSSVFETYEEAYKTALGDIPFVFDMDIGHTSPKMTMINGAVIDVKLKGNKGKIKFELI